MQRFEPSIGREEGKAMATAYARWILSTQSQSTLKMQCFEPSIDYCVVKNPKWAFQKFADADQTLTTQMKSVGEVMAIGRTFKEAFQKARRSLEAEFPKKIAPAARTTDENQSNGFAKHGLLVATF